MKNLKIFCISLSNEHLFTIKNQNYIPVGLGEDSFSADWIRDNTGNNISTKNKHYGEYTFHYWFWKNMLNDIEDNTWIGFCQYRKFWKKNNDEKESNIKINNENLKNFILQDVPSKWNNYNTVLVKPMFVNSFKLMKFIKYGMSTIIKKPSVLLNKNKRNIKFHFDIFHGYGNLENAINLLEEEDRNDFYNFVTSNVSFNPQNMLICKSKKLLNNYYNSVFKWLFKCEELFGFKNLSGYGKIRIYGFLAERYMSYWFNKNANPINWPIVFHDISNKKY